MKTLTKPEALITSVILILLATISLVLILSGCTYERIEGNLDLITQERPVGNFNEVISTGSFRVYITYDTVSSVEVRAESNIQPYLYTIDDGTTLRIGFKNGYNIRENYPVEVFVRTPRLSGIRLLGSGRVETGKFIEPDVALNLSGSGTIDCEFIADYLNADISGSGRILLNGSVTNTDYHVSGSGNIRSLDMPADNCDVEISGSGDIYTQVHTRLKARITGSGNIYYDGSPVIESSITGSGKIVKY